jgi:hypothetical protein
MNSAILAYWSWADGMIDDGLIGGVFTPFFLNDRLKYQDD